MKKSTKVISIIISTIIAIGGFFGFMCFKELWQKNHDKLYLTLMILFGIVALSGIVVALIIKDKKNNGTSKNKNQNIIIKIYIIIAGIIIIGGISGLAYEATMWTIYHYTKNIFFVIIFSGIIFLGIAFAVKTKRQIQETKYQTILDEKEEDINYGEYLVRENLGETIIGQQYIINDLIILNEDQTKSSQIDHIYINKNGVWCIETKNWSGMIFGKETDKTWTQVLNYGEVKYKHYNPIKQNETHRYFLKKVLGCNVQINSIVVFVDSDISNVKAENVYQLSELRHIVLEDNGTNLSVDEMEKYYNKLLKIKGTQISNEQHIRNISLSA